PCAPSWSWRSPTTASSVPPATRPGSPSASPGWSATGRTSAPRRRTPSRRCSPRTPGCCRERRAQRRPAAVPAHRPGGRGAARAHGRPVLRPPGRRGVDGAQGRARAGRARLRRGPPGGPGGAGRGAPGRAGAAARRGPAGRGQAGPGAGREVGVLPGHRGGPDFARRDAGAWPGPKGEYEPDEPAFDAARREFREELGVAPPDGPALPLGEVRQAGGKTVTVWAVEADLDP